MSNKVMTPDIRTKLNDCLGASSYSERDVVYILVQIYKFLERENKKDVFPTIVFYRNWACHAELKGYQDKFTSSLAEEMEDAFIGKIKEEFGGFSFVKLKQEISTFIEENIRPDLVPNKFKWPSFKLKLYEVIKDIPLVVKKDQKEIFRFEFKEPAYRLNHQSISIRIIKGRFRFNLDWTDASFDVQT